MKPKIYIETSVISYLTSPPRRDVVALGRQEVTRRWWETRRGRFLLVVSPVVLQEAQQGDPGYALARMNAMISIPVVDISARARTIASALIEEKGLPEKAAVDALHIAIAADCQSQFLLTWNFRHIANAQMRGKIEAILMRVGVRPPFLCTPDQLLGDEP